MREHVEPLPPLDYDLSGWSCTGELRLRSTWFGLTVLEELHEARDGRREWRKVRFPTAIQMRGGDR